MTNREGLNNLSDLELAKQLQHCTISCKTCIVYNNDPCFCSQYEKPHKIITCEAMTELWLQSERKDG